MSVTERLSVALADRYRIERHLGSGGMATVSLAHDIKHDRKVAVKVLNPELAAVLGAERVVVEIKTTAALQHSTSCCMTAAQWWPMSALHSGVGRPDASWGVTGSHALTYNHMRRMVIHI